IIESKTVTSTTLSYTTLLTDIINWYGLPPTLYKQCYKERQQQYVANIKMRAKIDGPVLRIKSTKSKDLLAATEQAAQLAIFKLKEFYQFEIVGFNLESVRRERKKRRIADINRVKEEMSFESLKHSYMDVCWENRILKEELRKAKD
ncbi:Beta-(1--_2)glucan export ATP-binding/permease protein NdvA, partial [Bienertia sinuspersici]